MALGRLPRAVGPPLSRRVRERDASAPRGAAARARNDSDEQEAPDPARRLRRPGGFLFVGLWRDPREVPSPLIDKPAPPFTLAQLHEPAKKLGTADMKGQVWLLNVWASWCVSCREEHPLLVELAQGEGRADHRPQLQGRAGDPASAGSRRTAIRTRRRSSTATAASASTAASTACPRPSSIDKSGTIRYKQIGPITPEALEKKILPLVRELQKS